MRFARKRLKSHVMTDKSIKGLVSFFVKPIVVS